MFSSTDVVLIAERTEGDRFSVPFTTAGVGVFSAGFGTTFTSTASSPVLAGSVSATMDADDDRRETAVITTVQTGTDER